jgi:acyl carrier protein
MQQIIDLMTLNAIEDAIMATVSRYASVQAQPPAPDKITMQIRPYVDLGMDSLHDLNITCEVEAILGVPLPKDQKLLVSGGKALSIEQAARMLGRQLGIKMEPAQ